MIEGDLPPLGLRRAAIGALVLMVVLGSVSDVIYLAAFHFRLDWFADPSKLVAAGSGSAELMKWAALTDLFSYYLPIAIVALALWATLRSRDEIVAAGATLAAFGYVLAGSIATATLAMAAPALIRAYTEPGADTSSIAALFAMLTQIVFRAVWQLVDGVFLGAWMVSVGWLLRTDQPRFARLSIALGALFWAGTALNVLEFGLARDAILGVVFAIWNVWSIWLAILLLRRRPPFGSR